jgi:hypothetical protein
LNWLGVELMNRYFEAGASCRDDSNDDDDDDDDDEGIDNDGFINDETTESDHCIESDNKRRKRGSEEYFDDDIAGDLDITRTRRVLQESSDDLGENNAPAGKSFDDIGDNNAPVGDLREKMRFMQLVYPLEPSVFVYLQAKISTTSLPVFLRDPANQVRNLLQILLKMKIRLLFARCDGGVRNLERRRN